MLNFGFKREGFFLVGTNHLCFCFVGSEWSIDGPYEGRHQAQSHADIRGEQSDSRCPGLDSVLRETLLFLIISLFPFFSQLWLGLHWNIKEVASYLPFFFWMPTNFGSPWPHGPFWSRIGSFAHGVLLSAGLSSVCSCWAVCQHRTWEFLHHCR